MTARRRSSRLSLFFCVCLVTLFYTIFFFSSVKCEKEKSKIGDYSGEGGSHNVDERHKVNRPDFDSCGATRRYTRSGKTALEENPSQLHENIPSFYPFSWLKEQGDTSKESPLEEEKVDNSLKKTIFLLLKKPLQNTLAGTSDWTPFLPIHSRSGNTALKHTNDNPRFVENVPSDGEFFGVRKRARKMCHFKLCQTEELYGKRYYADLLRRFGAVYS